MVPHAFEIFEVTQPLLDDLFSARMRDSSHRLLDIE